MATMEKVFNCLSCGQEVKLERKPDNSGWLKWNLDGTKHTDFTKNRQSKQGEKIEELAKKVETLESKIDTLLVQVQQLRGELKNRK